VTQGGDVQNSHSAFAKDRSARVKRRAGGKDIVDKDISLGSFYVYRIVHGKGILEIVFPLGSIEPRL
jgi:hypothetical protein